MKYFRDACNSQSKRNLRRYSSFPSLLSMGASAAWAAMEWKDVEAGSAIEAALYRWMPMPVGKVLGLRPPHEAVAGLGELIAKQPAAELYSLRAMNEEAALDFAQAEADWKKYVETAPDHLRAQITLADFYHRRLRPTDEVAALSVVARAPAVPAEKLTPVTEQHSWQSGERILTVVNDNALPKDVADQTYRDWLARYPREKSVYARYFQFLLDQKSFAPAEKLIAQYHTAFAGDDIFPVKARALLEYKKGSVEHGLAIYDQNFQPLWPQELVQSYFGLLTETRSLRKYLDSARAALERSPDDLNAASRIFFYYQQQGRSDAAQQSLADYRIRKQQRSSKWNSQELYTLAKLSEGIRSYPEAARYYYALYNTRDRADAQELALAGLADILLQAPEQGIRLGSGGLSIYRDIATMDSGPGFLNGILSLLLNSTSPQSAYSQEETRAVPYFHRAKAAELVHVIDDRFANSSKRPELHARLLETYATYGESEAVIRDGQLFLTAFPSARNAGRSHFLWPMRTRAPIVRSKNSPFTTPCSPSWRETPTTFLWVAKRRVSAMRQRSAETASGVGSCRSFGRDGDSEAEPNRRQSGGPEQARIFDRRRCASRVPAGARSQEYSRVLERYLSRLVSSNQLPQALAGAAKRDRPQSQRSRFV